MNKKKFLIQKISKEIDLANKKSSGISLAKFINKYV